MKIIGVVPARMAASRFPGKPLSKIHGRTMLEHVYLRGGLYENWDQFVIATCDEEIENFAETKGFPVIMTGAHHTRALDRVAEAVENLSDSVDDNDIIVCVQGDEPMMRPDMVNAVVAPLLANDAIPCTVLAMHVTEESLWLNPDTVKIIHNDNGEVLYTSRAPIPFCKGQFSEDLMARRIYGILAFRWKYLKQFTANNETRLELLEACDSNRILDMEFKQYIAPYPSIQSFSVDSPSDLDLVKAHILEDGITNLYQ
jgi:3-deoxy-manno-octulosonate cytidylyltransferase (CMP-KDO synthetase)|tara:strand:- start:515 stop:1285 length:771 start_codon:yes stop_codon:yes gene_type:complete